MKALNKHPAPYHPNIIEALRTIIPQYVPKGHIIFDPFAGEGIRLLKLCNELHYCFYGIDLVKWGNNKCVYVGDATKPDFYPKATNYAIVTSPTYNNGVNDSFTPRDSSKRMTYTVAAGFPLDTTNTGRWSGRHSKKAEAQYWDLHKQAITYWPILVIVNVKDSIRSGKKYPLVWKWAILLNKEGYHLIKTVKVPCPGHRYGTNSEARVDDEFILVAVRLDLPRKDLNDSV